MKETMKRIFTNPLQTIIVMTGASLLICSAADLVEAVKGNPRTPAFSIMLSKTKPEKV